MIDNLVPMKDAAEYLGYSVDGLREVVDRSRRRANGVATRGPFIKFFQAGRRGAVRFKREWLDQFIEENTVDPTVPLTQKEKVRRAKPKTPPQDASIFTKR